MIWNKTDKNNSSLKTTIRSRRVSKPVKRASSVSVAIKEINNDLKGINEISATENYSVKVAKTTSERKRVYKLAYDVYRDKKFIPKNIKKQYLIKEDSTIDSTILYIENKNGELVGSMTLITDNTAPLPASILYNKEIKNLQTSENTLVEFSRFVIKKDERNSKEILALLTNYSYLYSFYILKRDMIVCQVNPSHQFFYKHVMLFEQYGLEKKCPIVKGAPAVLMAKRMDSMRELVDHCYKLSNESKPKKLRRLIYNSYIPVELEKEAVLSILKDTTVFNKTSPNKKTEIRDLFKSNYTGNLLPNFT